MPIFPVGPKRVRDISAPATAITVSTEPAVLDQLWELLAVYVAYSATIAGNLSVTVVLNSGIAADYDVRLSTIDMLLGERWAVYIPDTPLPLGPGDVIDVVAPSGGGTATGAVQILLRVTYAAADLSGGWEFEQIERE